MSKISGREFEELLAPVKPAEFMRRYWDRKPCHISGRPNKFKGLYGSRDFWRSINAGSFEKLKAAFTDPVGKHVEVDIDAEQASALLASGMTLCAARIEKNSPKLRHFLRGIKQQLLLPGELFFNCYFSPRGKGFGTHFDQSPAWILQIEGAKHWKISSLPAMVGPLSAVGLPLKEDVNAEWLKGLENPDESTFTDVLLKPGDVLYLPAATWHRAEARGVSLALTLTVPPQSGISFLREILEKALVANPHWRRNVPAAFVEAGPSERPPAHVMRFWKERLMEARALLSNALTPETLCRKWYERVSAQPLGPKRGHDLSAPIKLTDVFCLPPDLPLTYLVGRSVKENQTILLYQERKEMRLPGALAPFFKRLAVERKFSVRLAQKWIGKDYSLESVRRLLHTLLQLGVVRRA